MEGAQVRIGEEAHQIRLAGLLETLDGGFLPLELQPSRVLSDQKFPYHTSKRCPSEEQVCGVLVEPDLPHGADPRLYSSSRSGLLSAQASFSNSGSLTATPS